MYAFIEPWPSVSDWEDGIVKFVSWRSFFGESLAQRKHADLSVWLSAVLYEGSVVRSSLNACYLFFALCLFVYLFLLFHIYCYLFELLLLISPVSVKFLPIYNIFFDCCIAYDPGILISLSCCWLIWLICTFYVCWEATYHIYLPL